MKDFKDKVALVTGAASGIGRAVAISLAREGAHVVLADVNEAGLNEVRGIAEGMRIKALAVRTDVSNAEEVKALCETAVGEMGGVDILVNVAGIGIVAEISEMELEDWHRILGVNLYGTIHTINFLLHQMIERRSGHIVNVASGCGLVALPALGGYNTSKFGLVGLTETLRAEVARFGIGVTAVCPGAVAVPDSTDLEAWCSGRGKKNVPVPTDVNANVNTRLRVLPKSAVPRSRGNPNSS